MKRIERKENRRVALLALIIINCSLIICTCASTPKAPADPFAFVDPVINKTFDNLSARLDKKSRVALTRPACTDKSIADYVFEQMYAKFINAGYDMPDRTDLDRARAEINLGLSGEVDDKTAAALGKFLGANVVSFGEIPDFSTPRQRLVYRALEVETGRMLAISTERF